MTWYILALKKYAIFNGRSRRMEYWAFNLVNLLILSVLGAVDYMTGTLRLSPIFALAVLIPTLSVTVRRLHDTNRSGGWLLILLVPILGELLFLIYMLLEGKRARNQYGPDPKGIGVDV